MTISVEKGSETYKEVVRDLNLPEDEVKEDSKKLLLDVYVDDGMTGGSKRQVSRIIGTKLEDGSFYDEEGQTEVKDDSIFQFL